MVDTAFQHESFLLVIREEGVLIADPERLRQHVPILRAVHVNDLVQPHPSRAYLAEAVKRGETTLAVHLCTQSPAKEVVIRAVVQVHRLLAQQERARRSRLGAAGVQVHGLRVIPQIGRRIGRHVPVLILGHLVGGGERVYPQCHVLQDPGGGGKRTFPLVIREGVIHLGDRLPVRRRNTVDETELQRLMPHQHRHGAEP